LKESQPSSENVDFNTTPLSSDQGLLERNANIPERPRTQSGRTITCYNKNCPDYRVERDYDTDCSCKRSRIKGVSDSQAYF
jgi:hypothetical protein